MTFARSLGITEIVLLSVFALAYLFFMVRVIRAASVLSVGSAKLWFKGVLRTLYFALFMIAFLGPSFGEFKKEVKSIGKDIFVLVDLSKSMDATDVQPNRLAKAKFELKNIVKAFSSDRVGLVIFSSSAFLQCPLTYDNNALMMFIETLNTNLLSSSGTDFAPALQMALEKFTTDEGGDEKTKRHSKVIILISDGEDFGEETIELANEIKDVNIKLFTLGIGTEKGSKLPDGYKFKRDNQGNEVVSVLNSNSLMKLADITGGKYFEVSDKQNDINRLINSINQIEGELNDVRSVDATANKYYYFLLGAFMLLLVDILLKIRLFTI